MKTYPLELELVIEETPRRVIDRSGSQSVQPFLEVLQNDAGVLYDVLEGVNSAKPEYQKKRRLLSAIKSELRPYRRKAESIMKKGTHAVGHIDITNDAACFILDLVVKPPEGFQFLGSVTDTLVVLEDKLADIKKAAEEVGDDGEGADIAELPPVGKEK